MTSPNYYRVKFKWDQWVEEGRGVSHYQKLGEIRGGAVAKGEWTMWVGLLFRSLLLYSVIVIS